MKLAVNQQNEFSRLQLLLRTFFGPLYIVLPHVLLLIPLLLYSWFLWIYSSFYALLKGEVPNYSKKFFTQLMNWGIRLHLAVYNMKDGYPKFGLNKVPEGFEFHFEDAQITRVQVLIRFLFGGILLIPHAIILSLIAEVIAILVLVAFFIVLFTKNYPSRLFDWQVGYLRWILRLVEYQLYLSTGYPNFGFR